MTEWLASVYQKSMPEDQIDAYYDLLSDIPADLLRHAIRRAVQESDKDFVPSVGMLRRLAAEAQFGVLPSWGEEWRKISIIMRKMGASDPGKAERLLGPFTWRIANQVGWNAIYLGNLKTEHMVAFQKLYEAAAAREVSFRRISEELRPVVGCKSMISVESKNLAVKS